MLFLCAFERILRAPRQSVLIIWNQKTVLNFAQNLKNLSSVKLFSRLSVCPGSYFLMLEFAAFQG